MTSSSRRLDTHLHLWDLELGVYSWLTPDLGPLHTTFTPEEAAAELAAAGVDQAVLVQAADDRADTAAMIEVAAANDWVAGVVGWLDLEDAAGAERALQAWEASPHLCGVRQLIHDDARADVLSLPPVCPTLRMLAARGIPLDVPDAYPRQLGGALSAARQVDGLVLVIDHLGKPPRGTSAMADWERQLREIAAQEGVVAKLSGLESADQPWSTEAIREIWETALEVFGPQRLMFGGDWPMNIAGSGYQGTVAVLGGLIGELSPDEQHDLWWRTGARVYDLPAPSFTSSPGS